MYSWRMGDSGEGLVDAEARIAERMEEREADRRRTSGPAPVVDPEAAREKESLKLARAELTRQAAATTQADDAISRLHRAAAGLPRALNNAAIAALMAAATEGKALVDDASAKKAVAELTRE